MLIRACGLGFPRQDHRPALMEWILARQSQLEVLRAAVQQKTRLREAELAHVAHGHEVKIRYKGWTPRFDEWLSTARTASRHNRPPLRAQVLAGRAPTMPHVLSVPPLRRCRPAAASRRMDCT